MALDTDKYLKKVAELDKPKDDKPKNSNYANRMSISGDSMRGDITLLPFIPDAFNGAPYLVIGDKKNAVREVNIKTSQTRKGNGWALILPKKFYGQLSPNEDDLYDEVAGLWDKVHKHMPDNEKKWKYIRSKKYTILAGILLEQSNLEGKEIEAHKGKPTFFLYPTIMLAKEIDEMTAREVRMAKGDPSVITDLFNNETTGRECALLITIRKKPDSEGGRGYNISASIREDGKRSSIVGKDTQFNPDTLKILSDPIESLLMWGYDHENHRPFSVATFNEIRSSLLRKIKDLNLEDEEPVSVPETKVETTETATEPTTSEENGGENTPF